MNSNKLTSPEKDDMIISKLVIRTVFMFFARTAKPHTYQK